MTATVRVLLEDTHALLQQSPPDADTAAQAAAAIGHCGRALAALNVGLGLAPGYRRLAHPVTDLAEACRVVAATWPGVTGRPEALTGAAADLLARTALTLSPAEQWAGAVTLARAARGFAEQARRFPSYAAVPQLIAVSDAAVDVAQAAMRFPPRSADRTFLDRPVPTGRPTTAAASLAAVEEGVAALAAAVHAQAARRNLGMGETLACAAVLELASRHAVAVAVATAVEPAADAPWRAAADAWHAVRRACAPFDDGTKTAPPAGSTILGWAARLEHALTASYGASQQETMARDGTQLTPLAIAARALANQAPDIAADLTRTAVRWADSGRLLARERNLESYESRNLNAAFATNRVVIVRGPDLDDLAAALGDARRLGMSLARELDRSAPTLGHQTHPDLAATHAARSVRPGDLTVLRVMAERAQLSAAATADITQWSFARRRQPPQPPRR